MRRTAMLPKRLPAAILLAAVLALVLPGRGDAAALFTITQQGSDVVVTGSGSIKTAGLNLHTIANSGDGLIFPAGGALVSGFPVAAYTGATFAFSGLGTGVDLVFATSASGDAFGFDAALGYIYVPPAYIDDGQLSMTLVFAGETYASLGLAVGVLGVSWGSGLFADSLQVQILADATPVPEPVSAALFGIGLVGLGLARRRSQRIGTTATEL